MKNILAFILLLLTVEAFGQRVTDYNTRVGYTELRANGQFHLPEDTVLSPSSNANPCHQIAKKNGVVYHYNCSLGKWVAIATGTFLDSAYRSNDTLYLRKSTGGELAVPMDYYTTGESDSRYVHYTDTTAMLSGYIPLSQKSVPNGVASLDGAGKVPLSQIPESLLGAVNYQGTYNASTNTPPLPTAASGNKGWYYVVSVAGVQQSLTLNPGDWVISNGSSWGKVDNNNAVTAVNGQTGNVTLTTTNINEGTNLYYTDTRARNSQSATAPLSYVAATGVHSISQATTSTNGYLSSTDWNTFNNKLSSNQNITLSGDVTGSGTTAITTAIPLGYVSRTASTVNPPFITPYAGDLNDITNNALAHIGVATNRPGSNPGFLLAQGNNTGGTTGKFQTYGDYVTEDQFYYRRGVSGGSWGGWYQVASRSWANGAMIQNQNASAQSADFWVSGSGRANGGFVGPNLQSANSVGSVALIGGDVSGTGFRGAQIDLFSGNHASLAGTMIFRTGITNAGAAQAERMRITNVGTVGIGTTSPQATLHISSALTSGLYVQNTEALSGSSGGFIRLYQSGTPSVVDQRIGGALFGTNPTGTTFRTGAQIDAFSDGVWNDGVSQPTSLRFRTTPGGASSTSEVMRITATGNVGIGTTTPATKLEVNGTITAPVLISPSSSDLTLQAAAGQDVTVATSGTNRIRVKSDGSVDIGVPSSPFGTILLNVGGNYQTNDAYVLSGGTVNAELGLGTGLAFLRTVSNHPLQFKTNDVENMRITAAGDVGIGTSTPATKLDVDGAITANGFITNNAATITGLGSASFTSLAVSGATTLSGGLNTNTLTSPSVITTGEFRAPIRSTAISTTLTATDHTLRATASGITLTLPVASTCNGRVYVLMNYNSGGNQTTSAVLVNGTSTTTIGNGVTWWVQSDGTSWYKIN